jgi:nicotianamine synthase
MEAVRVSAELSRNLGYGEQMTFSCEDVASGDIYPARVDRYFKAEISEMNGQEAVMGIDKMFNGTDWASFQVVFLAALVGMDSDEKMSILASLRPKLNPGTLVVARSAHGLREVLYPVSRPLDCLLEKLPTAYRRRQLTFRLHALTISPRSWISLPNCRILDMRLWLWCILGQRL